MAIIGRRTEIFAQAGLLFIPIVAYFAMVWQYAQNIPHWDDYDAALGFLNTFLQSDSWLDQAKLIVSQHNEHRIALTRVLTLLTYWVLGEAHFPSLIFLGNFFLAGTLGVLALIHREHFKEPLRGLWYFIPISFIFINLQFHENTLWAMASLQNFGVLMMALGALYLLNKAQEGMYFVGAVLMAAAAVFTSGNGLLVLLIGAWMLWRPGISWAKYLWWIVISLGLFALYFWAYQASPRNMSVAALIGLHPELVLNFVLYYLGAWARCFWGVWRLMSLVYGLGAVLGIVYLLSIRYDRRSPLLFGIILFILMSAGLTAIGRASESLDSVFYSRYRVYSVLSLVVLYWVLLDLFPHIFQRAGVWYSVLGFTIGLYGLSFWHGRPYLIQQSYYLKYGMTAYQAGLGEPGLSYPSQELARSILEESRRLGVYEPPNLPEEELNGKIEVELPQESKGILDYAYEAHLDTLGNLRIDHGWTYLKGYSTYGSEIFVVLRSEKESLVFKTMRELRADVSRAKKNPGLDNSGFTFFYPCRKLKPGKYRVGLYVQSVYWLFPGWVREGLEFGNYTVVIDKSGEARVENAT